METITILLLVVAAVSLLEVSTNILAEDLAGEDSEATVFVKTPIAEPLRVRSVPHRRDYL